jgi:hypothetical protein
MPATRLTAGLRSVRAPLVVERREDARRERRRTAALDQPGQRVQVHTGLARECLREGRVEARVTKARAAPGDYVGRFLPGPSLLSGCKVHVLLAQREWALLRRIHEAGAPGRSRVLDSGGETREPIRMRMHRHSSVPDPNPRVQPAIEAKPPTIAP